MTHAFAKIAFTPAVKLLQERDGSRAAFARSFERSGALVNEILGVQETNFIEAQRSFYMATVSDSGWPYVQHRGGAPGFLKVLDAHTLAFADYAGNRQLISAGNLATNGRAALILVDYAAQRRLKILGTVTVLNTGDDAWLADYVLQPTSNAKVQRIFKIALAAFDWNCPQHLPQRFEAEDVQMALAERDTQIEELQRQLSSR